MKKRVGSLFTSLRFRDFRFLYEAQILSELGDWAARVALALLVYDKTGSSTLTAATVAMSMLPWLGLGQALATLADRYPRRTVMVLADVVRATTFFGIAFAGPVWLILTLAFLAAIATPPFEAARAAMIPEVVSEDRYADALTLSNITYQAVLVLGYMAGGGLVALVGARAALMINAATFLLSGLLLLALREGRASRPDSRMGASLREAVRMLTGDPFLRRAAILTTTASGAAIVGEALVAVYVREHLRTGTGSVGLLAAMVPIGTIIASASVPRHGEIPRLLRASAVVVVLGGTGAAIGFLLEPGIVGSALSYASLGAVFAVVIPAYSFVGPRLPAHIRGTAFSVLQGTLLGGQALGALVGGALAAVVGAPAATGFALLPAIAFAVYAVIVVPGARGELVQAGDQLSVPLPERPAG